MMSKETIGGGDDGRTPGYPRVSARELDQRPALPPGYVITPGGPRHHSRVHQVEPGEAVLHGPGRPRILRPDGTIRELPEPSDEANLIAELGTGWITYARWNNDTGFSIQGFTTTWTVPPAPLTDSGQLIYLFNALQDFGATGGILQPVLQWGPSPAGGGASWQAASWYVHSGGTALHTPLVAVNPGDVLSGVIMIQASTPPSYNYNCAFEGLPTTSLSVQNLVELVECCETLEAYRITQCSDYPDTTSTAMAGIWVVTGLVNPSMSWTVQDVVTDCNQHTVVVNNSSTGGEVDIYYANPVSVHRDGREAVRGAAAV
jgi:hypothetical protein